MKPITYEVVVYDDGTSAVSLFDRDGETGQQSYVGRDFRDSWETQVILDTIRQPRAHGVVAGEVAALQAEVGLTFKQLCDAATLAGVRERERDEARAETLRATAERDALSVRLATTTTAITEAIDCLEMADPEGGRVAMVDLPVDAAVLALCERHGYGAVIGSAVRQWRRVDPIGAHTHGMCVGTLTALLEQLREAIGDA